MTRCKEYLPDELAILRPGIVVTQGARAATAMPARSPGVICLHGQEFYWIRLTHPSDRRGSFAREAKKLLPEQIEGAFSWWAAREAE